MASSGNNPELTPAVINWTLYDDHSVRFTHTNLSSDTLQAASIQSPWETLWLASEEQNRESAHRYVAIKIKSSSASKMGIDADPEVARLRMLEEHYLRGPRDKPRPYVQLLDRFSHEGPNGRHNCLVTELLGPSLASVRSIFAQLEQFLRPETVLRASRQLLQAVDFIHQAGLAHGDISPANVVFTCRSLLEDDDDDLLDLLGEVYVANPEPDTILPTPHLPEQLVQTAKWGLWEDETEEDIRLVDWGSAFPVGETVPREVLAQPLDLRAPETFFIGKFDHCHDIWRAGCVLHMLFYAQRLFWAHYADSYCYLSRMIRKIGPLPISWLPKLAGLRKESKNADEYDKQDDRANSDLGLIDNTFEPRRQAIISEISSGDEIYDLDEHTEYDFESLKSLRRPMLALLQFEPEARATVKESLEMMEWVDHRREDQGGNDEDKDEEGNER
ncbi:hypothetical protein Daus18300_013143 [Diaporthe australafricana]|uniref:Protein kinase domain-containing protein n=1 Tax=Diaporthe australafricana TaxID=127596 RepID=A0ABR3W0F0_9PEZI